MIPNCLVIQAPCFIFLFIRVDCVLWGLICIRGWPLAILFYYCLPLCWLFLISARSLFYNYFLCSYGTQYFRLCFRYFPLGESYFVLNYFIVYCFYPVKSFHLKGMGSSVLEIFLCKRTLWGYLALFVTFIRSSR